MAMPDAFGSHLRASLREGLLACRSLLDGWITSIEESEQRRRQQATEPKDENVAAPPDETGGMANP